jgi:HD-like signal output (HDOD) protein
MKTRNQLSATEVEALYRSLDGRLDGIGMATQPEVAARLLALVGDPGAGMKQYAIVVKPDASLTGRVLRLANSAYFAQIKPVTTLERACVLLGLERLKAVSLGFHLSRAAANDPRCVVSRRVWGESVFRACLCAELARKLYPGLVSEAFVVGLMLDAGMPLLHQLLGEAVERLVLSPDPPLRRFRAEFSTLPFTHVDVGVALCRRWRLPEVLARPIEWHHTAPGDVERTESVHVLHRIGYYVGALRLEGGAGPESATPLSAVAENVLGMPADALSRAVRAASREYMAMADLFRDVADTIPDVATLADRVHLQLVRALDEQMESQFRAETTGEPARFQLGAHQVEVEVDSLGRAVAFVRDDRGERILSYSFGAGAVRVETVLDALGIEAVTPEQRADFEAYIQYLAA